MKNKNERQHKQERKISQNPFISPLELGMTCLNGRNQSTLEWQHLKYNVYTNIQNNVTSWPASTQLAILFLQDGYTYFMVLFNTDNTWQYNKFELTTKPQDYHGLPCRRELSLTFFSLSTAECSLKTHTYSFPAFCWDLASRVAFSMHTIRHPVHYPLLLWNSVLLSN